MISKTLIALAMLSLLVVMPFNGAADVEKKMPTIGDVLESGEETTPCLGSPPAELVIASTEGGLTPSEIDWYCVLVVGGSVTFSADTVDAATAVDLYGCIIEEDQSNGVCGDDNFACSYPPASGYSCPQATYSTTSPFVYVAVARFDWTFWYGEPFDGAYALDIGTTVGWQVK